MVQGNRATTSHGSSVLVWRSLGHIRSKEGHGMGLGGWLLTLTLAMVAIRRSSRLDTAGGLCGALSSSSLTGDLSKSPSSLIYSGGEKHGNTPIRGSSRRRV